MDNDTIANPFVLLHEPWNIIYDVIAATSLAVGVILNSMTIYLYYRNKIVRSNFHYSLNIMSIISIVQQLSFIPFIACSEAEIEYPSSSLTVSFQCAFIYALHAFFNACFVNVYLICFLAVQRYIIITRPMKRLTFSNKTCRNYVICAIVFIVVASSPNLFSFYTDDEGLCQRSNIFGNHFSKYFAFGMVTTGLAIPVTIMLVAYILTIYYMFVKSLKIKQNLVALRRHRMKIVKSLGVLIAIFLFCWAPFGLNYLVSYMGCYTSDIEGLKHYRRVNKVVMLPPTMVATFNAVTFALSSGDIRKAAVPKNIKRRRHGITGRNPHLLGLAVIRNDYNDDEFQ